MTRVGLELGPSFCRYRGSPAQTGHFPEEACLGGDRLQSVSFRRGDDLIGRVEEDLKLLAPYTQCEVPRFIAALIHQRFLGKLTTRTSRVWSAAAPASLGMSG